MDNCESKQISSITKKRNFKKSKSDLNEKFNKKHVDKKKLDIIKSMKTDSFFVQKSNVKPSKNSRHESSFSIEEKSAEDKISESGQSFRKPFKSDTIKSKNFRNKSQMNLKNPNKLHQVKDEKIQRPNKKHFDKKRWRLQKYSKKYRLEQWEEKRKKAVVREYYKQIKDEKPKLDVEKLYEEYEREEIELNKQAGEEGNDFDEEGMEYNEIIETPEKPKASEIKTNDLTKKKFKLSTRRKAQMEIERIKKEKQTKKEEIAKQKEERKEALKKYKKKKVEKYKILNQKTKKGQPLMKGRIEMLLEKIQASQNF